MAEPLRILILEDNPADADLAQFELREAGLSFTAKVVTNKKDYVRELQEFSPDLILSDYDLPQYNGVLALAAAGKRCPDTPFILVTGAVSEDRAIEILTQGAKDYVLKTRLQQRLAPAVRRALAEAEERKEREKAEKKLQAALLYSRTLIEVSLDPLVTISPEGKVMDVNKSTEEITGVSREQIIGTDFSDYFTEPENARAGYEKVFSEGSIKDYPLAIRHITGRLTEVLYNAAVYKNEKGEVQGVFAAARDVTELKKAEKELRESNRTLEERVKIRTIELEAEMVERNRVEKALEESDKQQRFALETSHIGAWDLNLIDHSAFRTLEHDRIFGYTELQPQWTYEMFLDHVLPEDRVMVDRQFQHAIENQSDWNFECRIRRSDGEVRWIWATGRHKSDAGGEVRQMAGIVQDITERKQAEEELRRQREWLHVTLSSIGDAVIATDNTGNITFMNKVAEELTGWSFQEASARPVTEVFKIINEHTRQTVESPVTRVLHEGAIVGLANHTFLVRRDGTVVPIDDSGAPIFESGGKMQGVVLVFRDITMRKQSEEALRLTQQRLSVIVDSIADGFFAVDKQWRFTHINDEALKHFHKTRDEVIGRNLFELFPQAQGTNFETKYRQAMESGKPVHFETDSTIADMALEIFAYPGPENMTVLFRDITEKYRQTKALAEAHEQAKWLASFPEDNPNPVVRVAQNGTVLYCNPSSIKNPGWACKVGAPLHGALLPAFTEALAEKKEVQQEIRIGEIFYGITVTPFPSESYANVYGRDITKRKLVEKALLESEERYRELVQSSPEAVIVHRDGQFLYANPAALQLYGAESLEQLQRKTVLDLISPDERAGIAERMEQGKTGKRLPLWESKLIRLDGRVIPVESAGGAVDYNGKPAVQIIIRDNTERKNREKEQEKYKRMLRALSKSNQAMMRATDERWYMEEVCKIVVEDCGHTMVWVGFARDDEGKTVCPIAHSGFEEGYIDTLKITWADTERGRGPTGTAIRTGKPGICRNMLTDPLFEPWRREAIKRGYSSSIVLPLMSGGKAFGALTIYSREADPFTKEEVELLTELTNDLSYGIMAIRWRKAQAEAEEALRESEERFHAVAANTPDHILMQDGDLRYQLVINPQLGLTEADMLGKTDHEFLAKEDAEKLTAIKRKVLETGEPATVESSLQNLKGETEFFEGAYVPKFGPGWQADGLIGYFRNITKHKLAEDAILRAKEEWEQTFDTVPDLIAILDNRHRIIRVNKAMANALGVVPKQCVGLPCHEAVHGLSEPPAFCPHSLTCKDRLQHVAEVHEPRFGGDFLVSTTPLYDSAGQLVGSVHVARDITARKAAEDQLAQQAAQLQERTAQLEEANRELESFSYSVSHDLRAPLRAIDGFSRKLEREYGDKIDEKFADTINVIRSNAKFMGVLIDALLSFSRVQKTGMSISEIDMDKLVSEVWNEIREANKERKLNLKITKIFPGYGDKTLIRHVLVNLFSNAVKFTKNKKQGIIEMSSYKEDDATVYCLKDNGAGFDMEYYGKLFGVFQRLHSHDEYEGTGVGLAIVQRIVQRHGGRVWAEGKVGKGATFYFTLGSVPIDDAPGRHRGQTTISN